MNVFLNYLELFPKSVNPQQFLLECLEDLNHNLKKVGGRLHVFRGCPLAILRSLHQQFTVNTLCFDDDYETIWKNRNAAIEGEYFIYYYFFLVCMIIFSSFQTSV